MPLPHHDRFPYRPITERVAPAWPNGRGLAVYFAVNHEHFAFGQGLGATLAPSGQPDVLNYAWREYGNRVGAWRMLELFDALELPATALVNSAILDHCPAIVDAHLSRGDEIAGHGRTNAERQSDFDEVGEQVLIAESTQRLAAHCGAPPTGWLGPWIAETHATPDLLKEAGYRYVLDWCHDDRPNWMTTRAGPILSVPYPQEINDIPAIAVRRTSAIDFADMMVDQFDEMRDQARGQALAMGIALHPYIVGQPFRLRQLRKAFEDIAAKRDEVWITTAGAIAEAWETMEPAPSV